MTIFEKIWNNRRALRSIISTIYFNFHYLPFSQAVKLPILLYKPKLKGMKGSIKINGKLKFGMIKLGFPTVSLYPNSGIMYENHGGKILFWGQCAIGNNSAISIGSKGQVEIGDRCSAFTTFRLVSYDKVNIGERTRFGWDCLVMDTDFHKLTKLSGGHNRGHAPVRIGSNNWFGNGCKIMKRTQTPNYCVIQSGTALSGLVSVPEYSVIGNNTKVVEKASGLWRNIDDDMIEY